MGRGAGGWGERCCPGAFPQAARPDPRGRARTADAEGPVRPSLTAGSGYGAPCSAPSSPAPEKRPRPPVPQHRLPLPVPVPRCFTTRSRPLAPRVPARGPPQRGRSHPLSPHAENFRQAPEIQVRQWRVPENASSLHTFNPSPSGFSPLNCPYS